MASSTNLLLSTALDKIQMLQPLRISQQALHITPVANPDDESDDELTLSHSSTPLLVVRHSDVPPTRLSEPEDLEPGRHNHSSGAEPTLDSESPLSETTDLQFLLENTRPSLLVREHFISNGVLPDIWSTPIEVVPGSDSDEAAEVYMDESFVIPSTPTSVDMNSDADVQHGPADSKYERNLVLRSDYAHSARSSRHSASPMSPTSSSDLDARARATAKGKQSVGGRIQWSSPSREMMRLPHSSLHAPTNIGITRVLAGSATNKSADSSKIVDARGIESVPLVDDSHLESETLTNERLVVGLPSEHTPTAYVIRSSTSPKTHTTGFEAGFIRPRRRFLGVDIDHPIGAYARLIAPSPRPPMRQSPVAGPSDTRSASKRTREEGSVSDSSEEFLRRPRKRRVYHDDSEDEFVPAAPIVHSPATHAPTSTTISRAIPKDKRAAYIGNTCIDDVDLSTITVKQPSGLRSEATKWCHNCRNAKTENRDRARCWNPDSSGDSNVRCNKTWCERCLRKWYGFDDDAVSFAINGYVREGRTAGTGLGIQKNIWICPFCFDLCMCTHCTKHRARVRFLPSKHAGLINGEIPAPSSPSPRKSLNY